ncbi:MAG: hypothetical protein CO030_03160 [Candidatus Magasanikbacteria bacterium CG_4_9_14_0_2_um_filter_42_11]|uniref:Uncharacterized protein n=1 Tax=Candidatus Magasanikbacteria bacterium CG_4_9_14_0_2_um_filter_42_11 TaxID=1974643 RepID=A0A2M8F9J4_9BACT|nr:MAG: hypothetical protein COU34_00545 [Candidatus Magasanikbacteria bacterium CG10_big_fil_rev_8_21_14_0_10_43_9]PIY93032.1 MAG: hypothetical protein COY70_00180 [Candidatus Magasanikbacteria bacterium CG_4_10_14_0_8_um_filter_42_12]PJC52376.1 MAG: hypothetical protein CO030_03160 [Candidatus Magasanikbacteria bacterium CG_4_9_14_0_2_um_filter_42_11]
MERLEVEFIAAVVRHLPELSSKRMRFYIEHLSRLAEDLRVLRGDDVPSILTMEKIGPEKRSFECHAVLLADENEVIGHTMIERTSEMSGDACAFDEAMYLMHHGQDIPSKFRSYYLVIQEWRHAVNTERVAYLYWDGSRWTQRWRWLDSRGHWGNSVRVLRSK